MTARQLRRAMRMSKSKAAPVKMTPAGFAIAERAYEQLVRELQQLTARGTTSDVWYVDDPWSPTFVAVEPADDAAVMASFTGKVRL